MYIQIQAGDRDQQILSLNQKDKLSYILDEHPKIRHLASLIHKNNFAVQWSTDSYLLQYIVALNSVKSNDWNKSYWGGVYTLSW